MQALSWVVVAHNFNPSTPWVQGQRGLQSNFQDSQDCHRETVPGKTQNQKKMKMQGVSVPLLLPGFPSWQSGPSGPRSPGISFFYKSFFGSGILSQQQNEEKNPNADMHTSCVLFALVSGRTSLFLPLPSETTLNKPFSAFHSAFSSLTDPLTTSLDSQGCQGAGSDPNHSYNKNGDLEKGISESLCYRLDSMSVLKHICSF